MSNEISVDSTALVQAAINSQTAIDNLNVKIESWTNQGEGSVALEAFAEQFLELEKAMELYHKLLTQDMNSIKKIADEFLAADLNLASIWGGGSR